MQTGDTIRDEHGRTFQVGQLLGRGLWGKSYAVREVTSLPDASGEWVLKVPLQPEALGDGPERALRLARACRDILAEQAHLMEQGSPYLPTLGAHLTLHDGTPGLLMRRCVTTLDHRMLLGCSLEELVRTCVKIVDALQRLDLDVHGNLRPTNVLLTDKGNVVLSDPLTQTARKHWADLVRAAGDPAAYAPPEVRDADEFPVLGPAVDTYAVGMMLYRGAAATGDGSNRFPPLPTDGLDKARLVALKDQIHNRLKAELTNPRFHTRLAERTATLLNRALSRETSPSPPYRFIRLDDFRQRLDEILALHHPSVVQVGRLLLDRPPGSSTFSTDEVVAFSCTIACTPGVETHEEIACGIAVFNLDRNERIQGVDCAYTVDRHPSGRFRFGFRIEGLMPGAYRARVAFTIRESGHEPVTTETTWHVAAAPGFVPPPAPPATAPLPLDRPDPTTITERVSPPPPQQPDDEEPSPPSEPRPVAPAPSVVPREPPLAEAASASPSTGEAVALSHEPEPPSDTGMDSSVPTDFDEEEPDTDEPAYAGASPWTVLPLPTSGQDTAADEPTERSDTAPARGGLPDPLERIVDRLKQLVEGDAFVFFMVAAGLVIVILIAILFALR